MRNIKIILGELAEISQTSESDRRHYEFLLRLLPTRNNDAILRHIAKATEQPLYTSDYKATLRELSEHFKVKSTKNAEKRLAKLMTAIKNPDRPPASVQDELDEGGAAVINDVYRSTDSNDKYDGLTPLMAAIAKKDEKLIRLLINNGANLDNVTNINVRFGGLGSTALHIAIEMKLHDLVVMILNMNPDLNIKDRMGFTPLLIACGGDSRSDLAHLLINKGADLATAIRHRGEDVSPCMMAICNNNYGLVRSIMEKGYRPTAIDLKAAKFAREKYGYNDEIYNLLKNPFREAKNKIIRNGRNSLFKSEDGILAPVAKVLYAENSVLKTDLMTELAMIHRDQSHPVMKPLLDLVSLAAEGKHEDGMLKQKKLKILLTDSQSLQELQPGGESSTGLHNGNSVYVANNNGNVRTVLSYMLHEFKHLADAQLYADGEPYTGEAQKAQFESLKAGLKESIARFYSIPENDRNEIDNYIYSTIAQIFSSYKPDDQNDEILVKVPEIIGYLGVEDGYKWLEQHEPALLKFYEQHFNPACAAYVEQQRQKVEAGVQRQPNNFVK